MIRRIRFTLDSHDSDSLQNSDHEGILPTPELNAAAALLLNLGCQEVTLFRKEGEYQHWIAKAELHGGGNGPPMIKYVGGLSYMRVLAEAESPEGALACLLRFRTGGRTLEEKALLRSLKKQQKKKRPADKASNSFSE